MAVPRPARTWTLAQANAALPAVRRMLGDVRRARSEVLDAEAQLKDLMIVHGGGVRESGEGHDEWQAFAAQRVAAHRRLHDAVAALRAQGLELKDLEAGLVDFWAEKGTEYVFLCWKEGEDQVTSWHDIDAGFSGRQPVPADMVGA